MNAVGEIQDRLATLADDVGQRVVGVGRFGSGIVLDEGSVLTNAHVVRREQTRITFSDGRRADGAVAGLDPEGDLAVLSTDTGSLQQLDWGEDVVVGSPVFALANPGGRGL